MNKAIQIWSVMTVDLTSFKTQIEVAKRKFIELSVPLEDIVLLEEQIKLFEFKLLEARERLCLQTICNSSMEVVEPEPELVLPEPVVDVLPEPLPEPVLPESLPEPELVLPESLPEPEPVLPELVLPEPELVLPEPELVLPEPVVDVLPEPVVEPVVELLPESLPESLPEPVVELLPESLPEPVVEPVVEPVLPLPELVLDVLPELVELPTFTS